MRLDPVGPAHAHPAAGRVHTRAGAPRTGRRRCDSCPPGPANPRGANVEVKVVDPSANPYIATAAILGLALDGIERELAAPEQVTVDPSSLTDAQRAEAGIGLLTPHQSRGDRRTRRIRAAASSSRGRRGRRGRRSAALRTRQLRRSEPRRARREVPAGLERVSDGVARARRVCAAGRPSRARLLAQRGPAGSTVPDSRTRSTRPTPSRWPTSTRPSTPSWGSRCAPTAHRCWTCLPTPMRTRTGTPRSDVDEARAGAACSCRSAHVSRLAGRHRIRRWGSRSRRDGGAWESAGCTRWCGWSRSPSRPRPHRGTTPRAFDDILWRAGPRRGRHQVDPGLPRRLRRRPVRSDAGRGRRRRPPAGATTAAPV